MHAIAAVLPAWRERPGDWVTTVRSACEQHGIGLYRISQLEAEHGVALIRTIKAALDPLGLMNSVKMFRMEPWE